LGSFYSRALQVDQDQHLVNSGLYRLVRHPGYLGSLLFWLGVELSTDSWLSTLLVMLLMIATYCYRIASEEALLRQTFGPEYARYSRGTKRLIPFVF
jgi:protein-S-isoprenylcysteine O-methyltransferase